MASSLDLLFRINGDSTGAERAVLRAEAAQRRYDLAIRSARAEMEADLTRRVAKEEALREQQERAIREVAAAERQHQLMVHRAHAEMEADFARRAKAEQDAAAESEAAARRTSEAYGRVGTVVMGMGVAVGAGLALATREAIQWESAWASVTKTVKGSDEELGALEGQLRDMALVLPATHEEIAAVAAAAGALGVETPNVARFTRVMIDLGEATDDLDAQTAATGLAQFMNVIGTSEADVDRLGSSLVALGNNGASTEGQILAMGQHLAAAGKIARLSEGDVLGFASALTSVGIEAEAGGTAFSRVFISIDDAVKTGGASLETFASVAGMTTTQFAKAFRQDAAGAITSFVEGLGRIDASGQSLTSTLDDVGLGEIRVRNALLSAAGAGDLMREAVELGNDAWDQNNALVEEAAKRYETTEARLKMARNAIVDASIEIGDTLVPLLASAADKVAALAGWFGDLPQPVKSATTTLAALAATGAVVVGASLKMRTALLGMQTSLIGIPGGAKAATVGLKALGAANIALGLGAVAIGLNSLLDALEGHDLDTEGLEGDLIRLGQGGKATGDLMAAFGRGMVDLGPQLADAAHGFDLAIGSLGKEDGRQNIEKLDEALSNLVKGGDIDAAAAAFDLLSSHARSNGVSLDELTALFPQYQQELQRSAEDARLAADGAGDLESGLKGVSDEMGPVVETAPELNEAQELLAERFGLSADAAVDLSDAMAAVKRQQDILTGATVSAAEAEIDYEAALDAADEKFQELTESGITLAEVLDEQTGAFDRGTESGRAAEETMIAIRDAALQHADALYNLTSDEADYRAAVEAARQKLIEKGIQYGLTEQDAKEYADQILAIEESRTTTVNFDDAVARAKLASFGSALDEVLRRRTLYIDVEYIVPGPLQGLGNPGDGGRGSGSGIGGQSYDDGGRGMGSQGMGQWSLPADQGAYGMGGGTVVQGGSRTANITIQYPVAERSSTAIGKATDLALATL